MGRGLSAVHAFVSLLTLIASLVPATCAEKQLPSFLFILTDDQRYDALACAGNAGIKTPHLDSLAERGVRFQNAFVVLSICSPSRAACLTGRYNSANGVVKLGQPLRAGERTFAHLLKEHGYRTAAMGKWHLKTTPKQCGFDESNIFHGNSTWYGRKVTEGGKTKVIKQFIEDYMAERSAEFIKSCAEANKPFVLFHCTQVPHMTGKFTWTPRKETLAFYRDTAIPIPPNWNDDLAGRPPYLLTARNRAKARTYGYEKEEAIREHIRLYWAAITDMDEALGKMLTALREHKLEENTYVFFMGDNGWFLGEHGFTSKVLPYEESMRVPMIIAGPGLNKGVRKELALNIDLAPTMLDLAGAPVRDNMHGQSLSPLLRGQDSDWRKSFVYEAPVSVLGSQPLWSVRTERWKYVRTLDPKNGTVSFEELYDLQEDPREMCNLAKQKEHAERLQGLRDQLSKWMKVSPERGPRRAR